MELGKGKFQKVILNPSGESFHMRMIHGELEPLASELEENGFFDLYDSDDMLMPAEIRTLVRSGLAKFVQIEDDHRTSNLSVLEDVAFSPTTVTFVLHATRIPYLILLVGERVSRKVWCRAGKAVKAFQREYQKRVHAGRPRDLAKLSLGYKQLRKRGPQKPKAISMIKTASGKASSAQSSFSRLKKEVNTL